MIRVTAKFAALHRLHILGSVGTTIGSTSYSLPPFLLCSYPHLPVTKLEFSLELETFLQGKIAIGPLRDKDLRHFKVEGEIKLDALVGAFTKSTSDGQFSYYLGGRTRDFHSFYEWGFGGSSELLVPERTVIDSITGYTYHYPSHIFKRSLSFNGEYALLEVERSSYRVTCDENPTKGYVAQATHSATFLQRKTNGVYASAQYGLDTNGEFSFPSGKVPSGAVHAYAPAFAVVPSGLLAAYQAGPQMSDSEITTIFDGICSDLVGPSSIRAKLLQAFADQPPMDPDVYRELGRDIIAQQRYVDTNFICSLMEIKEAAGLLEMYRNTAQAIFRDMRGLAKIRPWHSPATIRRKVKKAAKTTAGSDLGTRYGALPLIRDLQSLSQGIENALVKTVDLPARIHSRRNTTRLSSVFEDVEVRTKHVMNVDVAQLPNTLPGRAMDFLRGVDKRGVSAKLETLWDYLLLSFVADWFANFGDRIAWRDDVIWAEYYPVSCVGFSQKHILVLQPQDLWLSTFPIVGTITVSLYDRQVSREIPYAFPPQASTTSGFDHWWEAGCLIVGRIR